MKRVICDGSPATSLKYHALANPPQSASGMAPQVLFARLIGATHTPPVRLCGWLVTLSLRTQIGNCNHAHSPVGPFHESWKMAAMDDACR